MKNKIRLALADDHSLMREGLAKILQMENFIEIVAKASNGEELLEVIKQIDVDIVLLDINMPHMNGIEALKKIKQIRPEIKVIMLTIHDSREYLIESLNLEADGYILKEAHSEELVKAIESVYEGGSYVHPSLAGELFKEMNRQKSRKKELEREDDGLTRREYEVLRLIANGYSNKGISDKLIISEKTVKNHVSSILKKLELQDRTQAAIYAIKSKIVE